MKYFSKLFVIGLAALSLVACKFHIAEEEEFPVSAVDFTYEVNEDTYSLDFYVGATIKFYPTVALTTDVVWDFGDGSDKQTGDTVYHKFTVAGNYRVTASANGGAKTNAIYVSDIKPIVTFIQEDSLIEVGTSYVSFAIELPNPDNLDFQYYWTFPEGTTNEAGDVVSSFVGMPEELGRVKFAKVGSQAIKIQTVMERTRGQKDWRNLELVTRNVQVALNEEAPTVYYAVKEGNIMALKIPAEPIEGVTIEPYDMGVSSGQHMLNLLYDDQLVYMLDCGKQFTYVDDVDGTMGDGKMQVMSVDASSIATVISNVGGTAFRDPFYGFIEGNTLYYSDRNTGIVALDKSTRNAVYSGDGFPFYVVNNQLNYYGVTSMVYGSFNACFGKINGVWYWLKTDNGKGIWRFKDTDILPSTVMLGDADNLPADGHVLGDFSTRSYCYNDLTDEFFFSCWGQNAGIYKCSLADLDNITPENVANYRLTFADGSGVIPIVDNGKGEGNSSEYIGVCQLALDKATGNVYFGYRSSEPENVASGLIRYNKQTGKLEHVLKNVDIYGICINPTNSKLF